MKNPIAPLRTHNHRDLRKILNRSLRTRQHLGKSATTRAQSKLGAKPHPTIFPKFPQLQLFGMQGASAMAPRVGVSTILLGPGFSLWLSSWNQWLEGPTMYKNGSGDCVWMDECRTSRSDESPANILVFWREDILDLSMIEANAQFISTNAKIKSENTQGALLT